MVNQLLAGRAHILAQQRHGRLSEKEATSWILYRDLELIQQSLFNFRLFLFSWPCLLRSSAGDPKLTLWYIESGNRVYCYPNKEFGFMECNHRRTSFLEE